LRGSEARLDCVQDHLGTTPLGLSSEFEAPALNGRVALLADKFFTLDVNSTVSSISESQVLDWINNWWGAHEIQQCLRGWETFTPECDAFLSSMVATIQAQAVEITDLASQMSGLVRASGRSLPAQPSNPLSRLASLPQGLQGGAPTTTAPSPGMDGSDLPDLIATVQNLKMQMKELNSKLASVSLEKGNHCVRFGNVSFRNPRDVIPSIKAQMPTSYFGCFVNAAILLEWILGNSGDDTLNNMERMHKLKIPSLA
jgi:hypothetical protein